MGLSIKVKGMLADFSSEQVGKFILFFPDLTDLSKIEIYGCSFELTSNRLLHDEIPGIFKLNAVSPLEAQIPGGAWFLYNIEDKSLSLNNASTRFGGIPKELADAVKAAFASYFEENKISLSNVYAEFAEMDFKSERFWMKYFKSLPK